MKKEKRIRYIVGVSTVALIGLVAIQLSWISQSAKHREAEFDHRVSMALLSTIDKLSADKRFSAELKSQMNTNAIIAFNMQVDETQERDKLEKLLTNKLAYYHVDLPFEFEIVNHKEGFTKQELAELSSHFVNTPHKCSLEHIVGQSGMELRLHFPGKQGFVFAQMGAMLAASVVCILLVMAGFLLTLGTIFQQKRLAEMTTDFINNMTHELKTPMASIALASNMLKKNAGSAKVSRYANIIHDENKKLECQVERVLDLARLERGEITLNKEMIDLHNVLKNAAGTIEIQVKERSGEIHIDLGAKPSMILGDEVHLSNVVMNLLDNANKYSPEAPEITLSTRNEQGGVVIAVEDRGIGMSPDKQKFVFDKFYRVSTGNVHNVKGFGLGLAYVKLMVDAHKGHISITSEPGKGSRFEIFLPEKA